MAKLNFLRKSQICMTQVCSSCYNVVLTPANTYKDGRSCKKCGSQAPRLPEGKPMTDPGKPLCLLCYTVEIPKGTKYCKSCTQAEQKRINTLQPNYGLPHD